MSENRKIGIPSAPNEAIQKCWEDLDKHLAGTPYSIVCPTLMVMTAYACAKFTLDTKEHIIAEFVRCLDNAIENTGRGFH